LVAQTRRVPPEQLLAVPVDVGKRSAVALVCDFTGELLVGRFQFALTQPGVAELVRRVQAVSDRRPVGLVRIGIEAAGHDHRPLTAVGVLLGDWLGGGAQPGPGDRPAAGQWAAWGQDRHR
jgi:transposase